ncbi:MAG: hypothetical protein JWM99_4184 [Verrucomicrobiales bacterium]|nr:hypothetical protein [Verrucomicrobiales bacterium]
MLRRDYVLRMIEEFVRALAKIANQKDQRLWNDAELSLDEESKRLTGFDLKTLTALTDTELLAHLLQTGDFLPQSEKTCMLSRVLIESAEIAESKSGPDGNGTSRALRLQALHLLLPLILRTNASDWPEFVPSIDLLLTRLADAPLPLQTNALLMQHFERSGQFAKAEDALFSMFEISPDNPALLQMGISFYHRLLEQTDTALESGNLPRTEVKSGLNHLQTLPNA